MKRSIHILAILCGLATGSSLFAASTAIAVAPDSQQLPFGYITNNGTITITAYTGPEGEVIIPDTINGYPVATFGDGTGAVFRSNNVTSVTIPGTVKTIAESSFYHSTALTNVTLLSGVSTIEDRAFSGCGGLISIELPATLTNFGSFVFADCWNLQGIDVDPNNPGYASSDGVLFDRAFTTLLAYPAGRSGSYTVPNGAVIIGVGAFENSPNLISLAIPDTVKSVGDQAFNQCEALTSVTIGRGVTNIGIAAFDLCYALRSIYFAGNAPAIANSALFGVPGTAYYLPGTAGWGPTLGDLPTSPWVLPYPVILNRGLDRGQATSRYDFVVSWATNRSVVVEACTDISNPLWRPLVTNVLTTSSAYFAVKDSVRTNDSARFENG